MEPTKMMTMSDNVRRLLGKPQRLSPDGKYGAIKWSALAANVQ